MAALVREADGRTVQLGAEVIVGRRQGCDLRLSDERVSGTHASIRWLGVGWELRDLGSLNGTFLDDRRLAAGASARLTEGCRLAFGRAEETWRVDSLAPPVALAIRADTGAQVVAEERMLLLPSDQDPQLVIYGDEAGGWRCEGPDGDAEVSDRQVVSAGGAHWRLSLPGAVDRTAAAGPGALTLEALSLEFRVSLDEEHVELELVAEGQRLPLKPRAHTYMLLTLARRRLSEQALPERERGWVYQDELVRMLAVDPRHLNVMICRARQQLASRGVRGAERVVERRPGTRQLRLGCQRARVLR